MNSFEEKISLLMEMIAFSVIDGKLDPREYEFLSLIANELQIGKAAFDDLFHQERKPIVIKSEVQRIHQFYRLALLMHIDGILDEREDTAIHEIGIGMGLNPSAMSRVLNLMEVSESKIIDPQVIFNMFGEQRN
jgi:hypothetical protein